MLPREKAEFGWPGEAPLERFAAELAALSPRARLDRDRLMYLAGQASPDMHSCGRRYHHWHWPVAFSGMTAIAAALLIALVLRPEPTVMEKVVHVPAPAFGEAGIAEVRLTKTPRADGAFAHIRAGSNPPMASRGVASYFDLRDRTLALGIEGWPSEPRSLDGEIVAPPAGYHELLKDLLEEGDSARG